jgi:hypothetical protein
MLCALVEKQDALILTQHDHGIRNDVQCVCQGEAQRC